MPFVPTKCPHIVTKTWYFYVMGTIFFGPHKRKLNNTAVFKKKIVSYHQMAV